MLTDGLNLTDLDPNFKKRYLSKYNKIESLAYILSSLLINPILSRNEEIEIVRLYDEIQMLLDDISDQSGIPYIQVDEYLRLEGFIKEPSDSLFFENLKRKRAFMI